MQDEIAVVLQIFQFRLQVPVSFNPGRRKKTQTDAEK